ncbi:unnamed protein product [Calypogeia fissa]
MAGVQGLRPDIATIIQSRQAYWAKRFQGGLKVPPPDVPHPSGLPLMPDEMKMWIQNPGLGFWNDVFQSGERKREQERISLDPAGKERPRIPGLPDEIVELHIWPCVATTFRGIGTFPTEDRLSALETLRALRLVSKHWNHIVNFLYEWAVYRMIRHDFNEGWIWYSYYPALKDPFIEVVRMLDLLPDAISDLQPLHQSLGVLPTTHLWIWRAHLNYTKMLRYDRAHLHCGEAGDLESGLAVFLSKPCYDCLLYPRAQDPEGERKTIEDRLLRVGEAQEQSDNEGYEDWLAQHGRQDPM